MSNRGSEEEAALSSPGRRRVWRRPSLYTEELHLDLHEEAAAVPLRQSRHDETAASAVAKENQSTRCLEKLLDRVWHRTGSLPVR